MDPDTAAQEADEMMEPRSTDDVPVADLGDDQVWPDCGPVCPDATGSPNE